MRDDADAPSAAETPSAVRPSESELRAKYLEYCSARISEVFLSLSDEETYALLEGTARDTGVDLESLGFQSRMRLVTEMLRTSVPLPDFESWAAEYLAHPERLEPFLLGLWKDALEADEPAGPDDEPEAS